MQTRKGSIAESWVNVGIGGTINWVATLCIVPILWNPASPKLSALYMTVFYTGVSLVRSFCIRRFFNHVHWENKP